MGRNARRHWGARVVVAVTLLVLATAAARAGHRVFVDDFNRPDGGLDVQNWSDSTATISGQQMCGDAQAFAIYGQSIADKHLRVSYEFSAADASGIEAYIMLQTGPQTYLMGCDGGFGGGGSCVPKVGVGMKDLVTSTAIPMETGKVYRIQGDIEKGVLTLKISDPTIADECAAVLATLGMDTGERFTELGVVVGRNADGKLTCLDNFRVEDLG